VFCALQLAAENARREEEAHAAAEHKRLKREQRAREQVCQTLLV
jgi:hypothetical protein